MNSCALFLPKSGPWHVSQSLFLQTYALANEALEGMQILGLYPGLIKSESQGWGLGGRECTVFSSSTGEPLAHLKSEHCFMGMKSLVIEISCWMWFRKKTCSRYGRCCLFLILFLPSLLIAKPQDKVILTRHQTSPHRRSHGHTDLSFCT